MDRRAHYFEFLEKAYDGQITVDIKVYVRKAGRMQEGPT